MSGQVTATALGDWPGTDPLEAAKAIRGELGTPHLPVLAELPQRGVGSDAIGRTALLLADLHADVQPHGWRIVPRPGRDAQRAESALSTDLNVLADVAGSEERSAEQLQVRILGPLSLMAGLYLGSGERVLADHGARRDIAQSLAAGVVPFLERVSRAVPGTRLTVQLDEPDAARVLGGLLPTASGYRTLRSVPSEEARAAWATVSEALHGAGAEAVVVNLPAWEAPIGRVLAAGADGVSLPLADLTVPQWEELASAVRRARMARRAPARRRSARPHGGARRAHCAAVAPARPSLLRARRRSAGSRREPRHTHARRGDRPARAHGHARGRREPDRAGLSVPPGRT
ncbi:hypothetical protein SCMU_26410 [Sinomonas cyclohexanicum]|uniref:Cobalamin-independent methionine synthase MetE C-terminal/archaeal domain-containing protein n=1 Tax=Sinomonas cyclohexanicum TaxID=322009 RepID=A0ABN6FJ17_SINCY|nr:hypothetical protein [Corynebacterium cyclohexanicum]BCT76799.1 hypothetical protein SCMU_26410 [Corynebacterium cyclohexanicum]